MKMKMAWKKTSEFVCAACFMSLLLTVSSTMPLFGSHHDDTFSVSSAEWHDRAYHNAAAKLRRRRLTAEIERLQTEMPTPKTIKTDAFLKHIHHALLAFPLLFDHHAHERHCRWKTYRYEQRAMHQLCMRVKSDKKLKREQVVVAYGAGQFTSTIKGKRGTPVKKLADRLARYVTLVRVDEFRTSQVCSNRCMYKGLDLGRGDRKERKETEDALEWAVEEEDEGGGDEQKEREEEEERASRQR